MVGGDVHVRREKYSVTEARRVVDGSQKPGRIPKLGTEMDTPQQLRSRNQLHTVEA